MKVRVWLCVPILPAMWQAKIGELWFKPVQEKSNETLSQKTQLYFQLLGKQK
jgi:hypothetical protein